VGGRFVLHSERVLACRMWFERYSETRAPIRTFYTSRLLRLLPVFWVAALLSIWVEHATDPAFGHWWLFAHSYWAWGVISNVFILGYADLPETLGALHVAWTLDIELQFYLVVPLLALATSRLDGIWFLERLLWVAAVAGLLAFLRTGPSGHRNFGCFALYFYIGWWYGRRRLPSARMAAISGLVALVCVAALLAIPALRPVIENEKHGEPPGGLFTHYTFLAVLALVTAPLTLATVGNASGPFDRTVGDFTYVLYLVHWPVMALHSALYSQLAPLQRIPSLAVAWLAVAILSALVFVVIDQPIERVRRRWVKLRLFEPTSVSPPALPSRTSV